MLKALYIIVASLFGIKFYLKSHFMSVIVIFCLVLGIIVVSMAIVSH